ncbi:MAG: hypothetical protein HZA77_05020 [Candidatus Schekmanbacteria bacterium]|nr:hypothetical protein [Candidatus Schekmanbacteria bacterium]
MNQHNEKRELEIQSERSKKLRAMGELAAAMAHEIRNPLGSIELFASMIKSGMLEGEEIKKFSEHILVSVKKLDCLITNLLIFSNLPKPALFKIDPNNFIEEFFGSLKYFLEQNNIELKKNISSEPASILVDREFFKQTLLNIVINSLQAMPEAGIISVNTYLSAANYDFLKTYYVIEISDTGCGISPDVIDKIFNPFFSTKEKKAGIGLSIVNNIMETHKGLIEVESKENKGALFRLKFPLVIMET